VTDRFRVGLTSDARRLDGTLDWDDMGLSLLRESPMIELGILGDDAAELRPDQVHGYDALLVVSPKVSASTLARASRLTLVARLGVGYDNIDVEACTENGVLLTITPDSVRRPMAAAAITFVLALSHKLLIKDRLTRAGLWAQAQDHLGIGLTGRSLGVVGFGNIGREVCALAQPFGMRRLAHDPYVTSADAAPLNVVLVDLETLLRTADFVCITCPLTPETYHMLDAERLTLMKSTAYLINVSRGPIVDQEALVAVLRDGRIQGAAIDVFEQEPVDPHDPLLTLDNVIVTPHAVGWTDELFLDGGRSAARSVLDVAVGHIPRFVVNRAVLDNPRLTRKLRRYAERAQRS
jgi:phosphoglycerate dehydrogenase-like enzyme